MHLTGYDYILDHHEPIGGLERLSGMIQAARDDGIETILCDNGDFLEGSPLAERAIEAEDKSRHPLVKAFNQLQYDAVGLGNHEFDYGVDDLLGVVSALDAPVICANVRRSRRAHLTTPWTIVKRTLVLSDGTSQDINVGIIGFVTPMQIHWGRSHEHEDLSADDILASAMTHLPAMRRAGSDIIVALAHTGIGSETHVYGMENAGLPLANLRGIDVLMLGHTHDQFPSETFADRPDIDIATGLIHGTPSVMAGHLGETLGQIDLNLTFSGGDWTIQSTDVKLIDAVGTATKPDPEFQQVLKDAIAPFHDKTLEALRTPIGSTPLPINTHFSVVGFDPTFDLISAAQVDGVQEGLANSAYASLPMIGATPSFLAGGRLGIKNYLDLPAGNLTAQNLAAMCPFDNPACAVLRRGWQVRQWLEDLSRYYSVVTPGEAGQPLLSGLFPSYHFDCFYGFDYAFDLSAPYRQPETSGFDAKDGKSRLAHLRFAGEDVLDDDLFIVAISRYRAMGGGLMGHVPHEDIVWQSEFGVRTFVERRLNEGHDWSNRRNWRFAELGGTDVLFGSSPLAIGHEPDEQIASTGARVGEFAEFQITL